MGKYYHYFVEGPDEEKLINTLKTDMQCIVPGKVQVFNVVQERLTKLRIMHYTGKKSGRRIGAQLRYQDGYGINREQVK